VIDLNLKALSKFCPEPETSKTMPDTRTKMRELIAFLHPAVYDDGRDYSRVDLAGRARRPRSRSTAPRSCANVCEYSKAVCCAVSLFCAAYPAACIFCCRIA
jgi:hypothetical protein